MHSIISSIISYILHISVCIPNMQDDVNAVEMVKDASSRTVAAASSAWIGLSLVDKEH